LAELVDDPSLVVLFSSDAGTTGLNLQHTVSVCINLELPWNPAVLEQRIGRIHRLGQTSPIDVFNLVSEEGIESRIAQVVAGKKAVFDGLFDGASDEVSLDGEGSLLESARKLVDAADVETALAIADEETDEREDIGAAAKLSDMADVAPSATDGPEPRPTAPPLPNLPNLEVSVLPDGGLRIDVPPAWRPVVGRLFASLARALGEGGPTAE
jgi:superfamily II DNA/RNA helicase